MHRVRVPVRDQQRKQHMHHIPESTSNIHDLFERLDESYFEGELKKNGVSLEWSQKMQSASAGYCYELEDKYKGSKRCYIVLNKPLLDLRPRSGVIDYLLHVMIHASLKIKGGHERCDSHCKEFVKIMNDINELAGTNITAPEAKVKVKRAVKKLTDKTKPKPEKAKRAPKAKADPKAKAEPAAKPKRTLKVTEGKENAKPRTKSSSDVPAKRLVPSTATTAFSSPQLDRFPATNYAHPAKSFPATNYDLPRRGSSKVIMREIREQHREFNDPMMKIDLIGYDDDSDDFTTDESSYDSDDYFY